VKPGDVVLDLGAGSGLHSFFACQAGARKVYAIEFEPVIDLARAAAAKNGFSQKIEFLEGLSTDLELPEKVDVIITNTGYLNVLRYLPDARRRFLKPGGRLVPGSVTNAFVPVCANSAYADCVESWSGKVFGFDFSDFRLHAVHTPYYNQFSEGEFVAEPQDAPAIDYSRDLPKIFHWKLEFTAKRTDLIHGILGWYTFHLGGGAAFSTKPPLAYSPYIWSQYFFPLERPLPVREGEKISVSIDMCPEGREQEPVWKWELRVGGQPVQSSSNFHTAALRIEH
jgi:protein arginine N-methyltransferase 1